MNPSICIPKVYNNVSKEDIIDIFQNKLNIGIIDRVDMIYKNADGENNKRVFVHFKKWNSEENNVSEKFLHSILNNDVVKIVYDFPWYWKCSNSRIPKPDFS